MEHQIITTADGSKTLFLPEMDEQYHSLNGAITESNYVYLDKGYSFHQSEIPVVFEVGFGTGLNALLTAIRAEESKRKTTFISIEKYPLSAETIKEINYGATISKDAKSLFEAIHTAKWGEISTISNYFNLLKIKGDLTNFNFSTISTIDIVFFDAFGPDKQPEMWDEEYLQKIYNVGSANSVFVTYSAKGEIRRRLERCGYKMERLPGPPGKRQMLRGIKLTN